MKKIIEINSRKVGFNQPPYIIAELSGNHNGDIERAKSLIKTAYDAGADAIKLQTYTADSLTIDTNRAEFTIKEGKWAGNNLYELYKKAHTPWDWLPILFAYAREIGITIFSSPFDNNAVQLLKELDAPAYKIASNELTDWPLIEAIIDTKKPIILSTGTGTKKQIGETIDFIHDLRAGERLIVLHCVSAYPALSQDSNLKTMIDLRDSFNVLFGLSDHSLGTTTSVAAVALGASVIEKHVTLDREDGGPDSSFSLEPIELQTLCCEARQAWESLGQIKYGGDTNLQKKGIFTRQLWSIAEIKAGDELTWENIKSIRAPQNVGGETPMNYKNIIGKTARVNIARHEPITKNLLR